MISGVLFPFSFTLLLYGFLRRRVEEWEKVRRTVLLADFREFWRTKAWRRVLSLYLEVDGFYGRAAATDIAPSMLHVGNNTRRSVSVPATTSTIAEDDEIIAT